MRLFLIKVCLVIFVVVTSLAALEYESQKLDLTYYKIKKDYIEANYQDLEGLILGPSHIWRSINPEWLNYNAASLAFSGSAINIDYKMYRQYEDAPNLKFVLFDLSAGYKERFQIDEWISYNKLYYYFGVKSDNFEIKDCFYVRYPIEDDIKALYDEEERPSLEEPANEWGFPTEISERKDIFKRADYDSEKIESIVTSSRTLNRHNVNKFDEQVAELSRAYLLDLVKRCKERDIKVIFISPPKYYVYNEKLTKKHEERRAELLEELIDNEHTYFWNLEKMIEQETKLFYNVNHVNPDGAKVVTAEVNRRLKAIGIN